MASNNHEVVAFEDKSDSHNSPIEEVEPVHHHSKEEAATDMVAIANILSNHHDAAVNATSCDFIVDDPQLCRLPHGLLLFSI